MSIYKQNEKYTLLLGDVLDELKKIESNSIDMIFTSPPYNIDLKDRKDTNIATYDCWNDNLSYDDYKKWQVDILEQCYRVLKSGGGFVLQS